MEGISQSRILTETSTCSLRRDKGEQLGWWGNSRPRGRTLDFYTHSFIHSFTHEWSCPLSPSSHTNSHQLYLTAYSSWGTHVAPHSRTSVNVPLYLHTLPQHPLFLVPKTKKNSRLHREPLPTHLFSMEGGKLMNQYHVPHKWALMDKKNHCKIGKHSQFSKTRFKNEIWGSFCKIPNEIKY